MKSRILPLTSVVLLVLAGASTGCGTISAGLMDAYWIDALYDGQGGAGGVDQSQLDAVEQDLQSELDRIDGTIGDLQNELDQPGVPGAPGQDGQDGQDGQNGADGADGEPGLDCWDLNGNGVKDPAEDRNGDGVVDAFDCQGQDGADGEDGEGVLARAQVDANGVEVNDSPAIDSSREAEGTYRIIVAIPEDVDTGDPGLNWFDFPVVVTPGALFLGGGVEIPLVASVQPLNYYDDDGNGTRDTLDLRVYIRRLQPDMQLQDADFSIVVLEP